MSEYIISSSQLSLVSTSCPNDELCEAQRNAADNEAVIEWLADSFYLIAVELWRAELCQAQ